MARRRSWLLGLGAVLAIGCPLGAADKSAPAQKPAADSADALAASARIDQLLARFGQGQIIDEPVSSVERLIAQLAEADLVVGTRFHNILLAMMLNKPVIALSYHEKIASLMAGMGMADYCQNVDELDVDVLVERFLELEKNAGIVKTAMERKVEHHRKALDEQYARIFRC